MKEIAIAIFLINLKRRKICADPDIEISNDCCGRLRRSEECECNGHNKRASAYEERRNGHKIL